MQIAIIVSQYNQNITDKLLAGAQARLRHAGVKDAQMNVVKVPGAVEIPLTAKLLAQTKKYQSIICLGAVIRGETSHYDYVCQQVSQGCQQIMLEFNVPIIFGVLTTNDENQAEERVGGRMGHKGEEAADAALAMINIINTLN